MSVECLQLTHYYSGAVSTSVAILVCASCHYAMQFLVMIMIHVSFAENFVLTDHLGCMKHIWICVVSTFEAVSEVKWKHKIRNNPAAKSLYFAPCFFQRM